MNNRNSLPQEVQDLLIKNHADFQYSYFLQTTYDMHADEASFYAFIFGDSLVIIWKPTGYEYTYLSLSPDEIKSLILIEGEILNKLNIISDNRDYTIWVDKKQANELEEYSRLWVEQYDTPYLKIISTEF